MGEHTNDANCLTFIRNQKYDSNHDGTGNPQEGMVYFNTTDNKPRFYNGSSWGGFGSSPFTETGEVWYLADANDILATGNEQSPDVGKGGLCLNQGDGDGLIETLKSSDVAHGITDIAETDTYGQFSKVDGASGGLLIEGLTEDVKSGVVIRGYVDTDSGPLGTVAIEGYRKSGTGTQNLQDDDCVLHLSNRVGGKKTRFWGNARISTNEDAPDVGDGGLCLNQGDDFENIIALKNTDISHPFTDLDEEDTFCSIKVNGSTGMDIAGYGESNGAGLLLEGYTESPDSTHAPIIIRGRKSNGGTSWTSVGASEALVEFLSGGGTVCQIYGDGDIENTNGTYGTLDLEDDIGLLQALNTHLDKRKEYYNDARTAMGKHIKRAKELNIIRDISQEELNRAKDTEVDENTIFMSHAKINALQIGCIVQMWKAVKAIAEKAGLSEQDLKDIMISIGD